MVFADGVFTGARVWLLEVMSMSVAWVGSGAVTVPGTEVAGGDVLLSTKGTAGEASMRSGRETGTGANTS